MAGKKVLFLFLGLAMPVLIFLFLKMFGKNEFDVPLPVIERPDDCGANASHTNQVADSVVNRFTQRPFDLLVVNFGSASKKLDRIAEGFGDGITKVESREVDIQNDQMERLERCHFAIHLPATIVVLDSTRQIRGYYDGTDRDELDRLEAEIKILLKKY